MIVNLSERRYNGPLKFPTGQVVNAGWRTSTVTPLVLVLETVNNALLVTNAATSMYPSNFILSKRILSGSLGKYVTSDFNSDVQTWETNAAIVIKAGESATSGFQLDLANCTFTNRVNVGDVFTQMYDWKMNDNPTDLGSKVKFNNI